MSLEQNRKARFLAKARKELDALYAMQNGLCYWCHSFTAIVANIAPENVVLMRGCTISWRVGEDAFEAKVATTDHVKPRRDGGTNDVENLVMACADCNKDRTRQGTHKPTQVVKVCPRCGGAKHRKHSMCTACYVVSSSTWLASHGWRPVASGNGHHLWLDPETNETHVMRYACEVQRKRLEKEKESKVTAYVASLSHGHPSIQE